jgi:glycosyltransferase involved in cell wall biosynthesis
MSQVSLLHYSAPPIVGGVESVLGHHARLLADDGHQVRIVAGRGEQMDARIPFVSIPLVDSRGKEVAAVKAELDSGRVPAEFGSLVARIGSQLRGVLAGTETLIAHNVCSLNKNLALTAALWNLAKGGGVPRLVLWHHDLAWTTPRYRGELHDGYPWALLRTPLPGAVQVAVSEARRQELGRLYGITEKDVTVVPNGVDVASFLKLEPETWSLYTDLDLVQAGPILLLPARITPRKNIELAVRMMAKLRVSLPGAVLLVTGALGPHNPANRDYAASLRALRQELGLERAVHFLTDITGKPIPDAVVADLYRIADLLFFPSREEGFGIPILEAALANLLIYCADIAPLRSLGGSGVEYFSPDDDPAALADRIARSLERDGRFALRRDVRAGYSWEAVYREHIRPLLSAA